MGTDILDFANYIGCRICFKLLVKALLSWLKAVIMKDMPNLQASKPTLQDYQTVMWGS